MDPRPTPYALGTEDGEALWFFGTLATFNATAEQTGGQYTLVEQIAPRGVTTPLHVQPEDHESFYVLDGELTFYLEDGQPIPASAGSFVHIPRGAPHTFQVDSETARVLDLTTPQHEYFFGGQRDAVRRDQRLLPGGQGRRASAGVSHARYAHITPKGCLSPQGWWPCS
jgi:quercetin dioxygenase-like cupin family protein